MDIYTLCKLLYIFQKTILKHRALVQSCVYDGERCHCMHAWPAPGGIDGRVSIIYTALMLKATILHV